MTPDETKLIERVAEHYRRKLADCPDARAMLAERGIVEAALVEAAGIGAADGSIAAILPADPRLRESLTAIGVLGAGGEDLLAGCLVVTARDPGGRTVGLVGYPPGGKRRLAGEAAGCVFGAATARAFADLVVVEDPLEALARAAAGRPATIAVCGRATEQTRAALAELGAASLTVEGPTAWARALRAKLAEWGIGGGPAVSRTDRGFAVELSKRRYVVESVSREQPRRLRALVRAIGPGGRTHLDAVDLYSARERLGFCREAAGALGADVRAVEEDLARLVALAEGEGARNGQAPPAMTDDERDEAMELLSAPDLPERIASDLGRVGLVGERENKLAAYLVAVSRKLRDPLSLLVLSRTAAGKSTLASAVAALVPPEDVLQLTRLTGQALFYKQNLRHKLLLVEEESGVTEAAYPLRILQSARRLAVATATGSHEVEGPVAVIVTTTQVGLDEETRSRFLVVSVDESVEQTARIHEAQRRAETAEGIQARDEAGRVRRLHANAQRLLRGLDVVNPLAPRLTFPTAKLSTRREHAKYLALIRAVALLRQYQKRPHGETIQVDAEDVALANELARPILGASLDDLAPASRRLLSELHAWRATGKFTRREAREALEWGQTQLWVHLRELVEHELVLVERGKQFRYELAWDGPEHSGTFGQLSGGGA